MTVPSNDHSRDSSDDEIFRQIVEGFAETTTDPVPRWPVSEDVAEGAQPAALDPVPLPVDPPPVEALPGWLEPAALEDDGHYVPPAPPRLPRPKLRTIGAVLMLLLGFAVLFAPFRIGLDDSPMSLLLGVILTGGGAAFLLASMRDAPGRPDDPDDGAVV